MSGEPGGSKVNGATQEMMKDGLTNFTFTSETASNKPADNYIKDCMPSPLSSMQDHRISQCWGMLMNNVDTCICTANCIDKTCMGVFNWGGYGL